MSTPLVIVSRGAQPLCVHAKTLAVSEESSAVGILAQIDALQPRRVWIVSEGIPQSLEIACRLQSKANNPIPVGIVSSISELTRHSNTRICQCEKLLFALQAAKSAEMHELTSARRFVVDQQGRRLASNGASATCSPMELRFLIWFLHYPQIAFSRMELLHKLSSNTAKNPRLVDVIVRRIRSKVDADSRFSLHLSTVRGIGYVFQHNSDVFIDSLTRDRFVLWPAITKMDGSST